MKANVKQRKMMLVLPLLVVPFLTMAFWSLGGGKGTKLAAVSRGLNPELPGAHLKEEKGFDKLSYYDQADKDSVKMEEWMRNDPYFKDDTASEMAFPNELEELTTITANKYNQQLNPSPYAKNFNNPEAQIMQTLKVLQDELNRPAPAEPVPVQHEQFPGELERLENMLKVSNPSSGDDEMKQLEGTLEKILDIQHPERVKERSVKYKEAAYAVRREAGTDTLVKGFFSYNKEMEPEEQNSIEAIIAANQTIVNGAVVKFRTVNDIYVNGQLIPKDNIIAGIAILNGERLTVEITTIRCGKNLFNVKLSVYDMDGLAGIYIPGTINRDVAKESVTNGLSLADMTTPDPSLKAQATATGVGALKNLIGKKTKLTRVLVKAGYKVLFKNQH